MRSPMHSRTRLEFSSGYFRDCADDEADARPNAARAINIAHDMRWLDLCGDTNMALAAFTGYLISGGSVAEESYVPIVCEGNCVSPAEIQRAFQRVGIRLTRQY